MLLYQMHQGKMKSVCLLRSKHEINQSSIHPSRISRSGAFSQQSSFQVLRVNEKSPHVRKNCPRLAERRVYLEG